ncbi:MAG: FHA domain-containing protein [Thermoflexales bacterium]|nr:FHA domain-containing protein [Thermoflexales bacterium]MDW8350844.1 FHA domain-containing protein [Anaerolineae bacterium]
MEFALVALRMLLVIALYAFLGALLWALLRERASPPMPAAPTSRLMQLADDGTSSREVRSYAIYSAAWIGRDPNCLVCADDEFASARHAQVLWRAEDQAWWIEDNLSRNGTFVNGQRVMRCRLKDGDVIGIGRLRFKFESNGAQEHTHTPSPPTPT